jgi:predicted Zn-dependent protease
MAGVLGHEIGHVTARHGNQRISKQIGFNVGLALGAVAVGVSDSDSEVRKYGQVALPGIAVGGNLVLLKYGRDDESEADMLGMRYMERAGYDPSGQLRVMEVLEAASSGARTVEWLATHPYPETRIERINKILNEQYPNAGDSSVYVINSSEYQQRMLTPLSKLAPPKDAQQSSLLLQHPALWCGQCRAVDAAE